MRLCSPDLIVFKKTNGVSARRNEKASTSRDSSASEKTRTPRDPSRWIMNPSHEPRQGAGRVPRVQLGQQQLDQGSYADAAMKLAADPDTVPPLPEYAKQRALICLQLAGADPKIIAAYMGGVAEVLGTAYRCARAETWERLDPGRCVALLDAGFRELRREHERSRVPEPIDLEDADHRLHFALLGLLSGHPGPIAELQAHAESLPAAQRLRTLRDLTIGATVAMSQPKRRHRGKLAEALSRAWDIGMLLGLLATLGELDSDA